MSTPIDPAAERSFTLHDLRVEVVAPEDAPDQHDPGVEHRSGHRR